MSEFFDKLAESVANVFSKAAVPAAEVDQIKKAKERNAQITEAITNIIIPTTEASSKLVEATEAQATAESQANLAKAQSDMAAQNQAIAFFEASGGINRLTALAEKRKAAVDEADKLLNEVDTIYKDEHVGIAIVDNIINDFRSVDERAQYNIAKTKIGLYDKAINDITSTADAVTQTTLKTQRRINDGTLAILTRQQQAKVDVAVTTAELQAIQSSSAALVQGMNATSGEISQANATRGFELREAEGKRAVERFEHEKTRFREEVSRWATLRESRDVALATARFNLEELTSKERAEAVDVQRELAREQLADTKDPTRKKALQVSREETIRTAEELRLKRKAAVANIKRAQALLGKKVSDIETDENEGSILGGIDSSTAKEREAWITLHSVGTTGVIGATPSTAVANLQEIGNIAPTALENDSVKLLIKALEQRPPNADIDEWVNKQVAAWDSSIKEEDKSNPRHAPPFSVLEGYKSVQGTKFYQKVLKDRGIKDTTYTALKAIGKEAIAAGNITIEDFVDGINAIYAAAVKYNNDTQMPERVGIAPQTAYNTPMESSGLLGSYRSLQFGLQAAHEAIINQKLPQGRSVDLTNYSHVLRDIIDETGGKGWEAFKRFEASQDEDGDGDN